MRPVLTVEIFKSGDQAYSLLTVAFWWQVLSSVQEELCKD